MVMRILPKRLNPKTNLSDVLITTTYSSLATVLVLVCCTSVASGEIFIRG